MNIAIVGIQGVPANYGGFESLVENIIGENSSPSIHYTIFAAVQICQIGARNTKDAT